LDDRGVVDGTALERAGTVRAEALTGTDRRAVARGEIDRSLNAIEGARR
jgi:hypothetical protein